MSLFISVSQKETKKGNKLHAQEKKKRVIYFHFPDFVKIGEIRTAQGKTAKPSVYGICGHIPPKSYFLFSGTGRKGNKMGIRKSPVKSRLPELFIGFFIALFPFL